MQNIRITVTTPYAQAAVSIITPLSPGPIGGGDIYYYHKLADTEPKFPKGAAGRPKLTALVDFVLHDLESRGQSFRVGKDYEYTPSLEYSRFSEAFDHQQEPTIKPASIDVSKPVTYQQAFASKAAPVDASQAITHWQKFASKRPRIDPSKVNAHLENSGSELTPIANHEAMSRLPVLQVTGLSSVAEDPNNTTPIERTAEREATKLTMLRRMRPPPFKYAWVFYHDKHSDTGSYDGRLSLLAENIITVKPFWAVLNNFPILQLKMKDSVHFFKRGVKPVWEDSRNINGGAWTFRVPKDKSEQFWQEALMLAVGEQFASALQARDDICGITFSARFNSNLVTIWNRDGSNQQSIDNILATVLEKVSPEIKPKEGSYYYKKHAEHAGYDEVVAGAKEGARKKLEAHEAKKAAEKQAAIEKEDHVEDALVTEDEGNMALLKDAEGEDVETVDETKPKGSPLKDEVRAE